MASRKSNVILTIEQRQTIVGQLESGVAVSAIAAMYHVHPITIRRIRQDAARINRLVGSNEKHKKIKRFKKPMYEDLENKLHAWFLERRAVGVIIPDAVLMEKAVEFAKDLQIPTFRASRGWATNFKKRHDTRLLNLHGEKASADQNAATVFIDKFKTLMEEEEDICIANVYNMDETGLVWKGLPKEEERTVTDDEGSETDNTQDRYESNDSDEESNSDQEEVRLGGRTKHELEELKYIHERLKHLCVTDPPHIRELYEVLRRYHFGEYDKEATQRRELGHSSHE